VGALSVMLGTVGIGTSSLGSASAAVPGAREFHAPRIPGPNPAPGPTRTPGFLPEATPAIREWTATNWSGYALTGTKITNVVGTWKVPTVETPVAKQLKKNDYSSSWVGIDGFNNTDLIQAGTEQDWLHGTKFYEAWWEILPAAETPITSMAVHPGDAMTVSITEGASARWTIVVSDVTTHQSFTVSKTYNGPRTSAEWIQERPRIGHKVATLAHDSNVTFDLGTVNGANPGLTTSDAGAMYAGQARISTPSAPNPNRDGFAVAYGSAAPPAPSS
jgi:Peptidase A4 family